MNWTIHNIHDGAFGMGCRVKVADYLREFDAHSTVLIYDHIMRELGYLEEMEVIIASSGTVCHSYQAQGEEPTSSGVDAFVEFCRENGADSIVALGGGSTMDTAKLTGKVLANGGSVLDYLGGYTELSVGKRVFKPIICVPTTAGTGSESCWGIMCLNENTGIKTYTRHPVTRAVVDPYYCMKLPAYITAYTGMDALAQCVECLVNTYAMPNMMADMLSREGLGIAVKYLPKAVHDPGDEKAREMMSWAAMVSGYAITLRKTSSGHAIANQISDNYHLPHGVGVGCGMAALARYNVTGDPETTRIWAPYFGVECTAKSDMQEVGREVVRRLDALQKDIGMKSMKELDIPEDFCDYAAGMISKDKKWKIVPNAPDFELLRVSLHESWDY